MSLINKVDITKFSDEELQAISAETKLRIHLQAKNENLRDHLWKLVKAVGRLLDDKYSEGDKAVRQKLWTDMHNTGDKAREYLQNSEPMEPGEIETLKAENSKMRKALEELIADIRRKPNDTRYATAIGKAMESLKPTQ